MWWRFATWMKTWPEMLLRRFNIETVYTDYEKLLAREDIDVIDVCTRGGIGDKPHRGQRKGLAEFRSEASSPPGERVRSRPHNHEPLAFAAVEAGKHCLCEKPVAHDYRNTWRAHEIARAKGLKTKVGLTFRYAPSMQYMRDLIADGFVGEPFIFNGYEQNSQFISPTEPVTKVDLIPETEQEEIKVSSIEGYGAPIIDISLWFMDSPLKSLVGLLYNFVPYRTMPGGAAHPHQYRRRRCLYRRVQSRRLLHHPVQLRHGQQLSRAGSAPLRLAGRAALPPGRRAGDAGDAAKVNQPGGA